MPIPGGYYIKARKIEKSPIAYAPPHIREVWDLIIRKANHGGKHGGQRLERGQCLLRYKDIQDALKWYVGYRVQRYSRSQIETAMKWYTKQHMVTTTKTTRGLIITILNYDYYQDPKNYESHNENHNRTTMKPHDRQECKELKNDKNKKNRVFKYSKYVFLTLREAQSLIFDFGKDVILDMFERVDAYTANHRKGKPYDDCNRAIRNYIRSSKQPIDKIKRYIKCPECKANTTTAALEGSNWRCTGCNTKISKESAYKQLLPTEKITPLEEEENG